ncbi:Type IV secretion system protein virB6, partial [Xanthomonas arboricola pv. populi]
FYVIGTLFSMAMLSVVTAMVLKFTAKVAAAYWAAQLITLGNAEGLSSQALQQGGIGLIMTGLIISVPTLAAAIWQGNMGTFMAYSAFDRGGAASPGPQGQPAGSYMPQRTAPSSDRADDSVQRTTSAVTRTIAGADSTETAAIGSRGLAGQNPRNQV